MSQDQDKAFFRNYFIIIGILAVFLVTCAILANIVVPTDDSQQARRDEITMKNTSPVGETRMEGDEPIEAVEEEVVAAEPATTEVGGPGKQVYSSLCFSCHGTGLPGVPQLGDAAGWAERVAQGNDILYERTINGFTGASGIPMPPKGGNMSLSDDDVKAAVDYMVNSSQ